MSDLILPITNPANETINELNPDGSVKYEALRYQFIMTGNSVNNFNEREISRTIITFLQSDLCSDSGRVVSYDGNEFVMANNNTDLPQRKLARIYKQYDAFITKCMLPMIKNMKDAVNQSANTEYKLLLTSKYIKLEELIVYYMDYNNSMRIIEIMKLLL